MAKNPLREWFDKTKGRNVHKWMHYFDAYHRHFEKFRGRKVTVVEFGVNIGGSAQMWREYFGPRAKLYGVDLDRRCERWQRDWYTIYIGDQGDRTFLRRIANEIGPVDIVIDDGGHYPHQQIATFEEFYPWLKPDGVFLVEDLHTSYIPKYDGGLNRPGTFIEYAKPLIDQLNAYHTREPGFEPDDFTRSTRSMHIYDSIIVFEKGVVEKPHAERRGTISWEAGSYEVELSPASRLRSGFTAVKEMLAHDANAPRREVSPSFAQPAGPAATPQSTPQPTPQPATSARSASG